jgi:hypothetical protein
VLTCGHNFFVKGPDVTNRIQSFTYTESLCYLNRGINDLGNKYLVTDVIFHPKYLNKSEPNDGYDIAIAVIKPAGNYNIPPTLYNDSFSDFA